MLCFLLRKHISVYMLEGPSLLAKWGTNLTFIVVTKVIIQILTQTDNNNIHKSTTKPKMTMLSRNTTMIAGHSHLQSPWVIRVRHINVVDPEVQPPSFDAALFCVYMGTINGNGDEPQQGATDWMAHYIVAQRTHWNKKHAGSSLGVVRWISSSGS